MLRFTVSLSSGLRRLLGEESRWTFSNHVKRYVYHGTCMLMLLLQKGTIDKLYNNVDIMEIGGPWQTTGLTWPCESRPHLLHGFPSPWKTLRPLCDGLKVCNPSFGDCYHCWPKALDRFMISYLGKVRPNSVKKEVQTLFMIAPKFLCKVYTSVLRWEEMRCLSNRTCSLVEEQSGMRPSLGRPRWIMDIPEMPGQRGIFAATFRPSLLLLG